MWNHPSPVFADFETQSLADIKDVGGKLYAEHKTTRILMFGCAVDDIHYVWIPDHIRTKLPPHSRLWPMQLKPSRKVELYRGSTFPDEILDKIKGKPLVFHNAYGFDQYIWERFIDKGRCFLDTLYLARIAGRHGRLDELGKRLLGTGKDRGKKLLPLLTTALPSKLGMCSYPIIQPGDLAAFTTYMIADVEMLVKLWSEFDSLYVEEDVINAHNLCNQRGVAVDENLIDVVEQVSLYSVEQAAKQIAILTRGRLNDNNIRSVQQVHEWINGWGVQIVDDKGKPCLRKEIVQRYINSPYIIEENLTSATEIPPIVIAVLTLRMKALRITDAKVKRAKKRVSNGRVYDLHTYHQAHTGRASSSGVQIHNLPRPPMDLKLDKLLALIDGEDFRKVRNDSGKMFDKIKEELDRQSVDAKNKEAFALLTVDDVSSALLRPSFIPKKGNKFVLCDFSTVECRGVGWIADEEKLMKVFHRQDSGLSKFGPYEDFAARLYGIDISMVNSEQRQVAKPVVLGAGYGMGPEKMRIYAAAMGVDLVKAGITSEQAIALFRNTYTRIAGFKPQETSNFRVNGIWHKLEKAVKECVDTKVPQVAGKCQWLMDARDLVCVLPSGRAIHYPEAKIEDVVPAYCYTLGLPLVPKATVTYQSTRGPKSLYGGLITENVVQAICRDLLMCALIECEERGYNPVLHIHDECVCEVPDSKAEKVLQDMVRIMSTAPDWAKGFPVACEGFVSPRFVKKCFKGYTELNSRDLR